MPPALEIAVDRTYADQMNYCYQVMSTETTAGEISEHAKLNAKR